MKSSTLNQLLEGSELFDYSEREQLRIAQIEVDEGEPESRQTRLRNVQPVVWEILTAVYTRLSDSAQEQMEGAIALYNVTGQEPEPTEADIAKAAQELVALMDSRRTIEPNELLNGTLFVTE